jgi:uncharacterized protein YecE (DUF72 family)
MWGLKAWVGTFFPPKSRPRDFLTLYSHRLNTVEGNTTFYATPSSETVERWRSQTPTGFQFCLKFPQTITHRKRLHNAEVETVEFLERLAQLGDRCGPAFVQLPPTFSARNLPSLIAYLDALPGEPRYAVEVRHPDFFAAPVESALNDAVRERNVARVLFDARGLRSAEPDDEATRRSQERKPDVPVRFERTAPFAFVRFISHPEVAANAPLLAEWARRVADWLAAGDDVFFFVHNPNDALSPFLARDFHAQVSALYPLPPLLSWGVEMTAPTTQGSLF